MNTYIWNVVDLIRRKTIAKIWRTPTLSEPSYRQPIRRPKPAAAATPSTRQTRQTTRLAIQQQTTVHTTRPRTVGVTQPRKRRLNPVERRAVERRKSRRQKQLNPVGVPTSNMFETRAIDGLDALLASLPSTSTTIRREHLLENRRADVAYAPGSADAYASYQVKSATLNGRGTYRFHIRFSEIASMLRSGMGVVCIACSSTTSTESGPITAWHFYDDVDGAILQLLDAMDPLQEFCPSNASTPTIDALVRYDLRDPVRATSLRDCRESAIRKIVSGGLARTLEFLNEDDSQIPGCGHRVEQRSFAAVRLALSLYSSGSRAQRLHRDAYGPVDFHVGDQDFDARVQDKSTQAGVHVVGVVATFGVRPRNSVPYDPDSIDVLQLSLLQSNVVYVLPMRTWTGTAGAAVCSSFSVSELMRSNLKMSGSWLLSHAHLRHDLNDPEGTAGYVEACRAASRVPPLSDVRFYPDMVRANADRIGSKRYDDDDGKN